MACCVSRPSHLSVLYVADAAGTEARLLRSQAYGRDDGDMQYIIATPLSTPN
jgi:hypothetical protein